MEGYRTSNLFKAAYFVLQGEKEYKLGRELDGKMVYIFPWTDGLEKCILIYENHSGIVSLREFEVAYRLLRYGFQKGVTAEDEQPF